MIIRRMRIARWIPKGIKCIHSSSVMRIAFPLQQWLYERALMLGYTYIAYLVILWDVSQLRDMFHEELTVYELCYRKMRVKI